MRGADRKARLDRYLDAIAAATNLLLGDFADDVLQTALGILCDNLYYGAAIEVLNEGGDVEFTIPAGPSAGATGRVISVALDSEVYKAIEVGYRIMMGAAEGAYYDNIRDASG